MALNTFKCNYLTPLHFKGLTSSCLDHLDHRCATRSSSILSLFEDVGLPVDWMRVFSLQAQQSRRESLTTTANLTELTTVPSKDKLLNTSKFVTCTHYQHEHCGLSGNTIGHILGHESLLLDIIEGRMKGRPTRGRRRLQMLYMLAKMVMWQ